MSNEPTIEQMNEAIALFGGWKLIKGELNHVCPSCDEGKVPSGWCTCHLKTNLFLKDGLRKDITYFQYHSSWDWLHGVWDRFRDLKFDDEKLQLEHSGWKDTISRAICYNSMIAAHLYLYKAIQWYNNQLTTTNGNKNI
jgi:hypothetical protein